MISPEEVKKEKQALSSKMLNTPLAVLWWKYLFFLFLFSSLSFSFFKKRNVMFNDTA